MPNLLHAHEHCPLGAKGLSVLRILNLNAVFLPMSEGQPWLY